MPIERRVVPGEPGLAACVEQFDFGDRSTAACRAQEIRGTLQNPVVEKPSLLESLAGPALRLLKKGSELVGRGQCEVFYAGSVAAPK